jgi:hypothetical protein
VTCTRPANVCIGLLTCLLIAKALKPTKPETCSDHTKSCNQGAGHNRLQLEFILPSHICSSTALIGHYRLLAVGYPGTTTHVCVQFLITFHLTSNDKLSAKKCGTTKPVAPHLSLAVVIIIRQRGIIPTNAMCCQLPRLSSGQLQLSAAAC